MKPGGPKPEASNQQRGRCTGTNPISAVLERSDAAFLFLSAPRHARSKLCQRGKGNCWRIFVRTPCRRQILDILCPLVLIFKHNSAPGSECTNGALWRGRSRPRNSCGADIPVRGSRSTWPGLRGLRASNPRSRGAFSRTRSYIYENLPKAHCQSGEDTK